MFLISGTYEGNFLRAGERIKSPPDLSFFDFRNYFGAIPHPPEVNLIIQKVKFRSSASNTSHLMVSLCVAARDRMGRDGFFSCRMMSPEVSKVNLKDWFSESVGFLYRYLRNDAPLANGLITHIPEPHSLKVVDFTGLKSGVNPKRIARFNVDWRTQAGFCVVQNILNERLMGVDAFTIICGVDDRFKDGVIDILYDWFEEDKLRQLERRRKFEEFKRRQFIILQQEAADEEFWNVLFEVADIACIVLLALLVFFYVIISFFREFSFNGSDPIYVFCVVAGVVAFVRAGFKLYRGLWRAIQ